MISAEKNRQQIIRQEIAKLVDDYAKLEFTQKKFEPDLHSVPPSGKLIDASEMKLMVEAALDGWLTTGRFNEQFEKKLAAFLGVKKLITVNSGSSANLVAFQTLTSSSLGSRAIQKGDEVIAVAAGFPTTVNPIIQFGAVPVFVDIQLPTYNINPDLIEQAISPKTKAIMLAHTLGNPFNLHVVQEICKKYDLWLVEDCCDALGARYQDQLVGTFGDISTLSFYPAHHVTMGEGGAVFSNHEELMAIATSFRDWGRDCYCEPGKDNTCGKRFCWKLGDLPFGYDHKYTYSHLGYNLKITDMQAACGLAQLDKLDGFIRKRKANFQFLKDHLNGCENDLILPLATDHSDPSWFGFPLTIRSESAINRVDFLEFLDQHKIGTRLLFGGNLVKQPYMKNCNFRVSGDLGVTDQVMNQTFWVGLQPALGQDQLGFVAGRIKTFLGLEFD